MMPNVSDIIAYEEGEMGMGDMIDFFQGMIDSGVVWQLQGSYGRAAMDLIHQGYCHHAEENTDG